MLFRHFLISGFLLFLITGCNQTTSEQNFDRIFNEAEQSTVLISYNNRPGHGTGFFVQSPTIGFCDILTTGHNVKSNRKSLNLWISDKQKPTLVSDNIEIQEFSDDLDLAVIRFNTESGGVCPYKPLKLADETVKTNLPILVIGYAKGTKPTFYSSPGIVLGTANPDYEGYAISYTASTTEGMSGSPVFNELGEVIAIHGKGNRYSSFGLSIPISEYLANLKKFKMVNELLYNAHSFESYNDFTSAKYYFNRALGLDSNCAEALAGRGRIYNKIGRYPDALSDFNRAIQVLPSFGEAIAWRGETYRQMREYSKAIRDLDKAIKLRPRDGKAIAWRGETYRQMGLYQQALENLNTAIEIASDRTELIFDKKWTLNKRGETYRQMGLYQKALQDFNTTIPFQSIQKPHNSANSNEIYDVEDVWAIARRGATYLDTIDYDKSLEDLNLAVKLSREFQDNSGIQSDHWIWAWRGEVYRKTGDFEAAIKDFNYALVLSPNNEWAIGRRGESYRQLGLFEKALDDFNYVLEIGSDDGFVKERRESLSKQLEQLLEQAK